MSFEKFHLGWELTWPWLNLGNVFSEYPKLIQWYDTLGSNRRKFLDPLINVLDFLYHKNLGSGKKEKI
jgi:apolipoprotein N-acyltransferase